MRFRRLVAPIVSALVLSAVVTGVSGGEAVAQSSSGQTLIAKIQSRGSLRVGVDQGQPLVFKDPKSGVKIARARVAIELVGKAL
jgi:hypothetical protein